MKKVIQKRKIRVIQPEIVEYYCDKCGSRCGTRGNPKDTWVSIGGIEKHYCKVCGPDMAARSCNDEQV